MSEFVQNCNSQQMQSIKQYRSHSKGNYQDALRRATATALLTAQVQSLAALGHGRKGGHKYAAACKPVLPMSSPESGLQPSTSVVSIQQNLGLLHYSTGIAHYYQA